MSKTIKIRLSVDGVGEAIQELKNYREDLLHKTDELIRKLAEAGIPVIDARMGEAGYTYSDKGIESGSNTSHNTYVKINSFGSYSRAELVTEGQDILFIEFGAGVYHNGSVGSSPNPKGEEFGYTIGSYGKGQGGKKVWAYNNGDGKVLSHGTKATMPMYEASKEMKRRVLTIAKEVFGGTA